MSGCAQPLQSCDHVDSDDCTRKGLDLGVGRRRGLRRIASWSSGLQPVGLQVGG